MRELRRRAAGGMLGDGMGNRGSKFRLRSRIKFRVGTGWSRWNGAVRGGAG